MRTKYILTNTFTDTKISAHRSLKAAVIARRKHSRMVERNNGKGSYVTYSIATNDGSPIDHDELMGHQFELDQH